MVQKDKQDLEEVMNKEPVALYKVLNALNFHAAEGRQQDLAKTEFAKYIKGIYLVEGKEAPDNVDTIFNDIIQALEGIGTELDEIESIENHAKHKAYVKEHDLQWVLDIFREYTDQDPDEGLDDRLDYEFIYLHHHDLGLDFPSNGEQVIAMFVLWLEDAYSI